MVDKKNDKPKKKAPFQASIRCEDRDLFYTKVTTKIASWKYGEDLHGTFSERCLTTKLIDLFQRLGVGYQVDDNPEPGQVLVDKIPGVDECEIVPDGKGHVRIKYEGITRSILNHRRERIQKYLDDNDIDSEDYCLFICVTGQKQQELSDKYLSDMEKLKKLD